MAYYSVGLMFPISLYEHLPISITSSYYSLSETEEDEADSDNDVINPRLPHPRSSDFNRPPVVERPPFRKYGVNDFQYLKVSALVITQMQARTYIYIYIRMLSFSV